MNTKHTPGPWKAHCPDHENSVIIGAPADIGRLAGFHVASLPYCRSTREQQVVNARLIAAAPDLLAALTRALPWIGKLIADGGHLASVAPNDAIGAMHQAEAAIAKAKGEA